MRSGFTRLAACLDSLLGKTLFESFVPLRMPRQDVSQHGWIGQWFLDDSYISSISIRAKTSVSHKDNCFDSGPCEVDGNITDSKARRLKMGKRLHCESCDVKIAIRTCSQLRCGAQVCSRCSFKHVRSEEVVCNECIGGLSWYWEEYRSSRSRSRSRGRNP